MLEVATIPMLYAAYMLLLGVPLVFPALLCQLPHEWSAYCLCALEAIGYPWASAILVAIFFTVGESLSVLCGAPAHLDPGSLAMGYAMYLYAACSTWPDTRPTTRDEPALEVFIAASASEDESCSSDDAADFEILDRAELSDSSSASDAEAEPSSPE